MTRMFNGAAIAALVALAACGRDSATPTAASTLSSGDAALVGARLTREVGASFAAIALGPQGGIAASLARTGAGIAPAGADLVGCPNVSGLTDSDRDGVPDHAVFTFSQPACRGVVNGDTIAVTGVVQLSDPVYSPPPDPAAFGYVASLTDFTIQVAAADSDSSFVETRNGGESLLIGPAGLTQSHAFSIQHTDHRGVVAIADQWSSLFSPAPGMVLVPGAPLPAGSFATHGETSWHSGNVAARFQLATPVPLAYDPTCADAAPNKFQAGEIDATIVDPAHQAYIRIVFNGCAAPTITLVAGTP